MHASTTMLPTIASKIHDFYFYRNPRWKLSFVLTQLFDYNINTITSRIYFYFERQPLRQSWEYATPENKCLFLKKFCSVYLKYELPYLGVISA